MSCSAIGSACRNPLILIIEPVGRACFCQWFRAWSGVRFWRSSDLPSVERLNGGGKWFSLSRIMARDWGSSRSDSIDWRQRSRTGWKVSGWRVGCLMIEVSRGRACGRRSPIIVALRWRWCVWTPLPRWRPILSSALESCLVLRFAAPRHIQSERMADEPSCFGWS